MEKATSGIEKPHGLKVLKKNIARLLTVKSANK
jgi:ribosomal protein L29